MNWGLNHRTLEEARSTDVDEIAWRKGHKYQTLVHQIDTHCRIGDDFTEETLQGSSMSLVKGEAELECVCSDMWRAYLNVIAARASQAVHILDSFHIVAYLNKAIDQVRAAEVRQMRKDGYDPLLTSIRWLLLKKPENPTDKQEVKLKELVQYNLKLVRSCLIKEDFRLILSDTDERRI